MKKVQIELKNCFGIKELSRTLDFEGEKNTQVIYAPNGVMKTSLANVLRYISGQSDEESKDRLHPTNTVTHIILSDGVAMDKFNLFVADAEDVQTYNPNEAMSTLLASKRLKDEYDSICKSLDKEKAAFIKKLKTESESRDCESEILEVFGKPNMSIYDCFEQLSQEIGTHSYHQFKFRYNDVFDKKGVVRTFLEQHNSNLNAYVSSFNQLLSRSTLFRSEGQWQFGTYQADKLISTTSDGAFFGVHHKFTLQDNTSIESVDEFKREIKKEKNRIFNDPVLLEQFDVVASQLDGNADLRKFQVIITAQKELLAEMADYDGFRKKVWYGHLSSLSVKPLFDSFCALYAEKKPRLQEIIREAQQEQETWRKIVELFGQRFHMPFRIDIENRADVVLKQEAAHLQFYYRDYGGAYIKTEKEELWRILSKGEMRALYILQLLFELEVRKQGGNECLLVFDDIADSFDYRNKYAIVEYLYDLNAKFGGLFKLLILTHNFDFYRTIFSRLNLRSDQIYMAMKQTDGSIEIKNGTYVKDVYAKVIVPQSHKREMFITWIPFARNLIEYHKGTDDADYIKLTSCLHQKADTATITDTEVKQILDQYSQGRNCQWKCTEQSVESLIYEAADDLLTHHDLNPICIENKVVLSMAIRHLAEKYMKRQLMAVGLTNADLETNDTQTGVWTQLIKEHCPADPKLDVIEKVNMMTPELIHINSFMYEPLIDMSIEHLTDLYQECKNL